MCIKLPCINKCYLDFGSPHGNLDKPSLAQSDPLEASAEKQPHPCCHTS